MCFEANRLFKKAHAVFDQGRGFERGGGEGICHPFDGISLTYMLQTYSPHTDISHVGGHLACGLLCLFYI